MEERKQKFKGYNVSISSERENYAIMLRKKLQKREFDNKRLKILVANNDYTAIQSILSTYYPHLLKLNTVIICF